MQAIRVLFVCSSHFSMLKHGAFIRELIAYFFKGAGNFGNIILVGT